MSLLIAGSIATDHLMSFGGRFADSLVVDQLDKLSVSFLVDDLEVAERTFELLMGNEVAPRREFIVDSAHEVDRERIDA